MPILTTDIKLLAPERLLDTPDGGGRMTGRVVVDGQANNLFPDISELDRTYGRVSLRKAFVGVLTDGTDSYYGCHVMVADAPEDPRVSLTLFTTRSWTDLRDAARDRVERYLVRGVKWPGQLLERQLSGQRAIALLLKPGDAIPRVGQALVLVQDEAKATEIEQYVRVTRVHTVEREFTVSEGSSTVRFKGVVVTCEISDPLRFDFEGPPPSLRDDLNAKAVLRDTLVANAAVYYGIQPTLRDAAIGDLKIQVASVWSQLVPSAQAETPLVDLTAAGQVSPWVESGNGTITQTLALRLQNNVSLYLGSGCVPGSLVISVPGAEIRDVSGQLKLAGQVIGTLDYARGMLRMTEGCPDIPGSKTLTFKPAAVPLRVADTAAIRVLPETRGYTYTLTVFPPPQPGSLSVSYLAQGQWIDLRDLGQGALKGSDPAFGTGAVDYASGTVTLTTGALPDAHSDILYAWGTAASVYNRSTTPVEAPSVRFTTQHAGLVPGSLQIAWSDGSQNRVAHDDGHGGFSGDAQGSVRYTAGEVTLRPYRLPAGGAEFQVSYSVGPPLEVSFAHPLRNADGTVTVQLPQVDIQPGSVELEWNLVIDNYELISTVPAELQMVPRIDPIKIARDVPGGGGGSSSSGTGSTGGSGGSGSGSGSGNGSGSVSLGGFDQGVTGRIDYASGQITFLPDLVISIPKPRYQVTVIGFRPAGTTTVTEAGVTREIPKTEPVYRNVFVRWEYVPASATMPLDESALVKVRYRAADTPNQHTETITLNGLQVDLTERYGERLVPGSVRFVLGGKTYVDRLGSLVTDLDPATGAGTVAGTLDYASGRATIKVWTPGQVNGGALQSLLTELTGQPVDEVTFRIPAAPVRPGSVQVRATPLTGGQISATASSDGRINGLAMTGTVDVLTGVVRLRFGRWVTAAGREQEIWYRAEAVVDGRIFQPLPVLADTIRFNAVAYTYLPLSAEVLGLDPVRLPVDGKVPIYRPGDVAVIHHTARTPLPTISATSAGTTSITPAPFSVGRGRLSRLRILDATQRVLPEDQYAVDLDAGTVHFPSPPNLTGLVLPLSVEHRVEDMALIADTQINGVLTLTRPLTHVYPAAETRVSSALVIGDLQARAHNLFAQQTWTGEWKDSRLGANTTAQYNATVYPLQVTNRGAIQERWALIFTNTNEFRVIGEAVGQIALGHTASDLAPINPETHAPYFIVRAGGWGAGWSAGNVLRFNTVAANHPLWLARTVLQGPASAVGDGFTVQIRGDVDRE